MAQQALPGKLTLALLLGVGILLGSLAGCGRKGNPRPPADERDTFPGRYPKSD